MYNGYQLSQWQFSGFGGPETETAGPGLLCSRWLWIGGAFSFSAWLVVLAVVKQVL